MPEEIHRAHRTAPTERGCSSWVRGAPLMWHLRIWGSTPTPLGSRTVYRSYYCTSEPRTLECERGRAVPVLHSSMS